MYQHKSMHIKEEKETNWRRFVSSSSREGACFSRINVICSNCLYVKASTRNSPTQNWIHVNRKKTLINQANIYIHTNANAPIKLIAIEFVAY